MTKKDYIKLSSIIHSHEAPPCVPMDYLGGWNDSRRELAERLAAFLANDNPRFDHRRFIAACNGE